MILTVITKYYKKLFYMVQDMGQGSISFLNIVNESSNIKILFLQITRSGVNFEELR